MKICLINNLYPPYHRGGAEKVCYQLAKSFITQGNQVFIISTKPKSPNFYENKEHQVYYLSSSFYNLQDKLIISRLVWHLKNIFSFKNYSRVLEILNKEKPDLVISHNLMGLGFLTAAAIKTSGITYHHFLHDIQLLHPSGLLIYKKEGKIKSWAAKIYQALTRKIINSPNLIISPSNWLLQEHKKRNFFSNSATEIRPFSKIFPHLETKKENEKVRSSAKKFLFAGQIEKHKGIIFLITAFKNLATNDMQLNIAGDGHLLKKAQKIAREDKRIIFLGNLSKLELENEMKKNDLLIVPSLCYENSPLIIAEAKNIGLPVIAANIGGIKEAISENDKLFTPESASSLFAAIKEYNTNN